MFKEKKTYAWYEALCRIWYHLYNLKTLKTPMEKSQAKACNITKSNTPPWVFFTIFKLYRWYLIMQSFTYSPSTFIDNFQKIQHTNPMFFQLLWTRTVRCLSNIYCTKQFPHIFKKWSISMNHSFPTTLYLLISDKTWRPNIHQN